MAEQPARLQDGISQQMRLKAALQPEHVAVDERSLRDLLAFLRDYSRELRYFDENDQANGDWQAFFPQEVSLDEILVFLENPAALPEGKARLCQQPHFVLLLSFLQLLESVRSQLNGLTRRHLDFHFRQFLQLREKRALPDHVNVLVELAKHTEAFLLPAGSQLHAGKDSAGKLLAYASDEDTFLNQAQVAKLSAIYVDKKITGIREARESFLKEHGNSDSIRKAAFLQMLKMALGQPAPGDELPTYPLGASIGNTLGADFLDNQLYKRLNFIRSGLNTHGLNMSFHRFNELMKYKHQREPDESMPDLLEQYHKDWNGTINDFLKELGKRKNPNDTINFTKENDFNNNFKTALGFDPYTESSFLGLPDISSLNELYNNMQLDEVQVFIQEKMFIDLSNAGDSKRLDAMMQTKLRIDAEWEYVDSLLEHASGKKPKLGSLPDFKTKLGETLGFDASNLPDGIGSMDDLYTSIQQMQAYFYLSAYDLYSIINVSRDQDAAAHDWNRVYQILASAHQEKVFHDRKQALETRLADSTETVKLDLALALVLGDDSPENDIGQLSAFLPEKDFNYLSSVDNTPKKNTDLDKVYSTLAIAWRNREGVDPLAEKEEWQGLYATGDVTSVINPGNMGAANETQRWKTFGQLLPSENPRQQAEFGLAISSPILLLGQGKRKITLTLEFSSSLDFLKKAETEGENKIAGFFRVLFSTVTGWAAADPNNEFQQEKELSVKIKDNTKLEFTIIFSPDKEPISASSLTQLDHLEWPIIKILFHAGEETNHYYQQLKAMLLVNIKIDVNVSDLSDFRIWNDLQILDSKKPFEPFGSKPVAGSRFHIAHPELSAKELATLTFNITWLNLEKLTDQYYQLYNKEANAPQITGKQSFTIAIYKDNAAIRDTQQLFENPIQLNENIKNPVKVYWELNAPDFQHSVYPVLAAKKSTQLAIEIAKRTPNLDANNYFVSPAYTPIIKRLTLDYTSTVDMANGIGGEGTRIFHIYPFGHAEIQPDQETGSFSFLPQFDNAGELYIGLEKLKPPQHLSMLFQMAEGSADADLPPETVHWDYLSNNQWQSLEKGNILRDGTRGLIHSGIITFSLPASQPSTLLAPELYWLRASIRKYTNSVCDAVAIHTQAVSATLIDSDNAPDHLNQPLATGTIKKLVNPLPAIKAIQQPYTSFGGKSAEQDQWFYTRVSERLRHKQRALTPWDYEHLVLERFPQIYKAKCIPASLLAADRKPGTVELIVIPDIRNRLPADPFAPKAPVNLLADIRDYLQDIAPDSASIVVQNAHYVPFRIRMGVRFYSKYDEGYHKKLLNEEINRFLAPWAYTEGADIIIGGKIYANSIINFVERLPYIDYIAQLNFFSDDNDIITNKDDNSISTQSYSSVLVPEPEHVFDPIPETGYEADSFSGINYMRIELDFVVG